jgi:hypothetical protein
MLGAFVTLELARRSVKEQFEVGTGLDRAPRRKRLSAAGASPRVAPLMFAGSSRSRGRQALPCPEAGSR